jgi:transcriptional regulator with XRE-family HTH domain
MQESLGALLTRARLASGRSQLRVAEQLCAASGVPTVSRHELSRWERETRIPTTFWLRWLAHVLDLNLTDLERAAAVTRRARSPVQDGLRAITTSVSPGQSQNIPSAERFASSARTSPVKSSRRSPNRCGAEDDRDR